MNVTYIPNNFKKLKAHDGHPNILFPNWQCRFRKWSVGCVISSGIADALKNRGILSGKIASPNYRGKPQIVEETEPDPARLPARIAKEDTKVFFREESFEYSILAPARADGCAETRRTVCECTEQFHFSYFLFLRVLFVGRVRECGDRKEGEEKCSDGRAVFSIGDASGIPRDLLSSVPPPSSRSLEDSSRASLQILSPARDVEEAPKRVRCFR